MKPENHYAVNLIYDNQNKSSLILRPFYESELNKTLESIASKSSPMGGKNTLEGLFSDKRKTLKATVKTLLEDISIREKINVHLLEEISDEVQKKRSFLSHLENFKVHYMFDAFIEMSNLKIKIGKEIHALEKERRNELLECWRDMMVLRRYLLIAFKNYWDLVKRHELLAGDPGG